MKKNVAMFEAIATLIGAVIGAGILGIPYAVAQVGFPLGVSLLIGLTIVAVILQLMFAEVILRTKKDHQLPGYGGMYIGNFAKRLALLVGLIGGYGILLAYIIGQGQVLSELAGGSSFLWAIIFFIAGSYIIYHGLEAVKRLEVLMTGFIFLITIFMGISAHRHISVMNLTYWHPENIAIPYGVLLFALSGIAVIPQVRRQLVHREKMLPKVIIGANIAIFFIYLMFMVLVLSVTGINTTEVGTIGLGEVIGQHMIIMGNALAFFTISTSFVTIGLAMRRMFQYDYGMHREKALLFTIVIPFIMFVIGARDFITVISIVGGVVLGIQSLIVVLAFWRAQFTGIRKPEFTVGPLGWTGLVLIVIFVVGAVVTLMSI